MCTNKGEINIINEYHQHILNNQESLIEQNDISTIETILTLSQKDDNILLFF